MRKLSVCLTLLTCLSSCAWEPVAAQESSPRVCHLISDPDSFIKSAAAKASVMTITKAAEFGKAAAYKFPVVAAFILRDDDTMITVTITPRGYTECFTSVHEDYDTWSAVQRFFGRGA